MESVLWSWQWLLCDTLFCCLISVMSTELNVSTVIHLSHRCHFCSFWCVQDTNYEPQTQVLLKCNRFLITKIQQDHLFLPFLKVSTSSYAYAPYVFNKYCFFILILSHLHYLNNIFDVHFITFRCFSKSTLWNIKFTKEAFDWFWLNKESSKHSISKNIW